MHQKVAVSRLPFILGFVAACLIADGGTATAADVPWSQSRFQYVALKKDLRELLREFATKQDITLDIADGVEGNISGSFDLPPQAMLDLLASNHHFSWHYDGAMLYITPVKNVTDNGIKLRSDIGDQLRTRLSNLSKSDIRYSKAAETDASRPANLISTGETGNDAGTVQKSDEAKINWDIESTDKTLNSAISRWSAVAGWQLLWELPVDYSVDAKTTIRGTFTEAVETIVKSMEKTEVPMKAIFYSGNKVLRIVAREAQ